MVFPVSRRRTEQPPILRALLQGARPATGYGLTVSRSQQWRPCRAVVVDERARLEVEGHVAARSTRIARCRHDRTNPTRWSTRSDTVRGYVVADTRMRRQAGCTRQLGSIKRLEATSAGCMIETKPTPTIGGHCPDHRGKRSNYRPAYRGVVPRPAVLDRTFRPVLCPDYRAPSKNLPRHCSNGHDDPTAIR